MQVSCSSDGRNPRIDDDKLGTVIARLPNPMSQGWESLAHVRAAEHDDFRMRQVGIGIRSAVQTKRFFVACSGAHHTQTAVVIEVPRLKRERANFPTRYDFSFVSETPESIANVS